MDDLFVLLKASLKTLVIVVILTTLIAFFMPPIVHLGSLVYGFSEDLWEAILARLH